MPLSSASKNIYNSYIKQWYKHLIKIYSTILPPREINKIHINNLHITSERHVFTTICTCTLYDVSFIDACTHAVMTRNSSITNRSTRPLSTAASLFLVNFVCPSTNFAQYTIDNAIVKRCTRKSIFTQYLGSHVTRLTDPIVMHVLSYLPILLNYDGLNLSILCLNNANRADTAISARLAFVASRLNWAKYK